MFCTQLINIFGCLRGEYILFTTCFLLPQIQRVALFILLSFPITAWLGKFPEVTERFPFRLNNKLHRKFSTTIPIEKQENQDGIKEAERSVSSLRRSTALLAPHIVSHYRLPLALPLFAPYKDRPLEETEQVFFILILQMRKLQGN